jgi:hypothetical protein
MKRKEAQQVLMDTLSQNEQMLIEEIETLPNRLIDAMIKFSENQGKTLPIDSVIVKLVCECPPLESQFLSDGLETDWCLTCGGKAN